MNRTMSLLLVMASFVLAGCEGMPIRSPAQTGTLGAEVVADASSPAETSVFPAPAAAGRGWTDLSAFLVPSDGSRRLGTPAVFNVTRDPGSKIVFFDPENGDNATGELYWWDGSSIVDNSGHRTNAEGLRYGDNPLEPNLEAIAPFQFPLGIRPNSDAFDPRLRTHQYDFTAVAGGYPDWFLFRRGRVHQLFDGDLFGGQSAAHPMVLSAYGPPEDGRAIIDPVSTDIEYLGDMRPSDENPLSATLQGDNPGRVHMFLFGLEIHRDIGVQGLSEVDDDATGEPTSMHIEDCAFENATLQGAPRSLVVYRTILANRYSDAHNQGYFVDGFGASALFEESIFYRNGYKQDPRTHADPRRDIFSRNIYQGGGAQMGHTYRNVISADGASGGPQMRLGGLIEHSLIVEGYWFSSTDSNEPVNPWMTAGRQAGQSAVVRNNVQLVYRYPSPADPDTNPDTLRSDVAAQPGIGFQLLGASFGAEVYGNIISGAMMRDELGIADPASAGMILDAYPQVFDDGRIYSQRDNRVFDNIIYRTGTGLATLPAREGRQTGDWSAAQNISIDSNVFVAEHAVDLAGINLSGADQLRIASNRFYTNDTRLPDHPAIGAHNSTQPMSRAADSEGWPDPDRTLRRYVTEVLGLELLEWTDDPYLPSSEIPVGQEYDPTGVKTFMAVATNMRYGGVSPAPPPGSKPSWSGDYEWDQRYTAAAVVDWIREGFGLQTAPRAAGTDL